MRIDQAFSHMTYLVRSFDSNIFGYICKHDYLANVINGQKMNLLHNRRLPLVLDLDDTLVRLIGNERTRYVSEADAMTGKNVL